MFKYLHDLKHNPSDVQILQLDKYPEKDMHKTNHNNSLVAANLNAYSVGILTDLAYEWSKDVAV